MARQENIEQQQIERLFASLAEQVKLPFLQVAQAAQLLDMGDDQVAHKQTIIEASRAATQLIDGYLLHVRLQQSSQLQLEPVSVSSVLYDTSQLLDKYARMHDCEMQLDVAGKYEPVMAHAGGLKAALANIGYSFIEAAPAGQRSIIRLGVRRTKQGISTGIFTNSATLSTQLLKQARELQGSMRQPLNQFTSETAAGVFVADGLIASLGSEMQVSQMHGMTGLAAVFNPSGQLSLV